MFTRIPSVLVVLAVLISVLPGHSQAQSADCSGLEAYFALVDQEVGEGLAEVFNDQAFMEDFAFAVRKASSSDMGFLVLAPEEMETLATLLTVPGDALLMIEPDEIPEVAMELHNSALENWLLLPAMMRTIASGGVFGALIFTEQFEVAEAANLQAQTEIVNACPEEIAANQALGNEYDLLGTALGIDEPSDLANLSIMEVEMFRGVSHGILFVASEDAEESSPIPGMSTPVTATPAP